ncbi:MAG: ribosomal protein S6--L-glutamate ligase [Cognaticolwellia sp.]
MNSSHGLNRNETATSLDIAGAIIEESSSQVMFPDLDVRQRLMVSVGYGVAELSIPADSTLVGLTIQKPGMLEHDIQS